MQPDTINGSTKRTGGTDGGHGGQSVRAGSSSGSDMQDSQHVNDNQTQRGKMTIDRQTVMELIDVQLTKAYAKHGREQWGRHEFYAVLLEEVDELWEAIKTDAPQSDVQLEALQVAAMVFRYLELGDRGNRIP
jgi:NTP pyrophosphatase (non-canonical NTP hydrolase)